jgi:predicted RNA-binding protein with PIN domain
VAEPTFYLFDGYNVLHAGPFSDPRELVDRLASFVALRGARGVVVFDGVGEERTHGPLEVRYAPHADAVLERLAAELRGTERVCLVSSDLAVRGTSGQEVMKLSSAGFVRDLVPASKQEERPHRLGDRLDRATRDRLERLRRNRSG